MAEPSPAATRSNSVAVVGSGRHGLQLARSFAATGLRTLGFDPNAEGTPPRAEPTSPGLEWPADPARLGDVEAVVLLAPTGSANALAGFAGFVADHLGADRRVIVAGPVPPGATRLGVLPAATAAGRDVSLAYAAGLTTARWTDPLVVGGYDHRSAEWATTWLRRLPANVVRVSSLETAEVCGAVKAAERAVLAGAANELKVACDRMGVDVWEVVGAAGPVGLTPGPGDPEPAAGLLAWGARRFGASFRLVELAGEVNTAMPDFVVSKVADALNDAGKPVKGSRVLILGVAYKKDVDDPRESPGFELMDLLLRKGAVVAYNDPHIPELPRMRHWPHLRMSSTPLSPEVLAAQDCVLIATDHTAYDYAAVVAHSRLVVDTRNATKAVAAGRVKIVRA